MSKITKPNLMVEANVDTDKISLENYQVAGRLLDSLWNRYCNDMGATSLPYWIDKFQPANGEDTNKQANRVIQRLASRGVVITSVKHNYAEIELNPEYLLQYYTQEELDQMIHDTKLERYLPCKWDALPTKLHAWDTKLTTGIKNSGLARFGFAKAGIQHEFHYDTKMMKKYYKEIVAYSVKAMVKMEEQLHRSLRLPQGYDYQSLIEDAIDHIMANPKDAYVLGKLTNDSRGRAIYECLRTIFNPLANKMARALVVTPATEVSKEGLKNAYLFIAELVHGFEPNMAKKAIKGQVASYRRTLHNLKPFATRLPNGYRANHTKAECEAERKRIQKQAEKDLDNVFENIWLERVYNDLEALRENPNHRVTTPLEVDFSSSNMVMIGLLLGHNEYINHRKYMWDVPGLSKLHVKFAQTPYVFGSSASIKSLWLKNKLSFNSEQLRIMKKEQTSGRFAIANELKDIIIKHCTPQPVMELVVQQEKFKVECNKTKQVGDTTKQYIVLDSESGKYKVIQHTTTHSVPDLDQFRRYFMTGLIHNLDSQILDTITLNMKWVLPIHDAGLVTWDGATHMRKLAVNEMTYTYENRKQTMINYLKSIGLTQEGWVKYAKLVEKVEAMSGGEYPEISEYLLK